MLFQEVICRYSDWEGVTFSRILFSFVNLGGGQRVENA